MTLPLAQSEGGALSVLPHAPPLIPLAGARVLVLGMGESGLAMARWLARNGAGLRIADTRRAPPAAARVQALLPDAELHCGPLQPAWFADIDLIALSPGVPRQHAEIQAALARGLPLVSEIELFAWALADKTLYPQRPRVLAITGSNGKTTTTALTGALCQAAGWRTAIAGNIGPAALDALMDAQDAGQLPEVWVLELSSFQLEATWRLDPDAATVLNISEDHLDRYDSLADYAAAKQRIFGRGVMVLNRDDARVCAMARSDRTCYYFGTQTPTEVGVWGLAEVDGVLSLSEYSATGLHAVLPLAALQLRGRHNAANALAALALCRAIGVPGEQTATALAAFSGLPHRVEWVHRIAGVDYIDDSKGTNVGATVAAIEGLGAAGQPLVLILGGDGKGQDFSPLTAALARYARAVALIGRDAAKIIPSVTQAGVPWQQFASLEEAVRWSASKAQAGDAVLLSPACASLDMFSGYAARAAVFVAAVQQLAKGEAC